MSKQPPPTTSAIDPCPTIIRIVGRPGTGRPTIWMIVGQGPTVLAVGADGGCLDIFTFIYLLLSSFSLSLGDGSI